MATFAKRVSGWRAQIRKGGVSMSMSGFRTKADAQAWAAEQEAEILARKRGVVPDKTFAQLVERYVLEVSPTKRGAREEEFRLRRMIGLGSERDGTPRERDPLADVRLEELSPQHIAEWRDRRLQQVSAKSVLREWSTLSHACTVASKEWGWLRDNPTSAVSKPKPPAARTRRYSQDEIDRLLLATGYAYDQAPLTKMARVGAAMLFAIETAMRAGEIVGIQWAHVDRERRLVHLPMTKNGHARDVPLSKEAVRILEQLEKIREDGHPVFQISSESLDALFRKATSRALIEDLHFHDTRREALTRMATPREKGGKGIDVMTLAKISGHRDLRILQNTYYAPDMGNVAALLD